MNPTQAQQNSRLNPEATNVYIPQDGIFRSSSGEPAIYKRTGNTVQRIDLTSLLTPQERQGAGSYGAQTQIALDRVKQQYGFDFNSIPQVNMGDFLQSLQRQGIGSSNADGAYIPPITNSSSINDFLTQKPASLSTQTINNTPNTLSTPPSSDTDPSTGLPYANPNAPKGPYGVQGRSSGTTPNSSSPGVNNTSHPSDTTLQSVLNNPNLTSDQKALVQHLYDTISTNDTAQAQKLIAGFNAATAYSDPYFKAQTLIATDALSRALGANDGDLAFQEEKLRNTLADLTKTTNASKDYLSFQHTQELQKLADSYKTDLENTQQNLATTGHTSSSVRSNAEKLLNDQNSGLVESSNRQFSYQTGNLDTTLANTTRDTNAGLAYLTDKNTQARIDALRKTEGQVGSSVLSGLGYTGLLGGVGGEIPRKQVTDALSFSNSFVF